MIEEFLGETDHLYPGITTWWRRTVFPEIESGQRICRAIAVDGEIAAVAIAKIEERSSKLCTLRVAPQFRGHGMGEQLLRQVLAGMLSSGTRRVHFTISEQIFQDCGSFFAPYGFQLAHWKRGWYVNGMYELAFTARASLIRDAISGQGHLWNQKGPQVAVLSVRPRFAEAIERGLKRVEFRKRFSSRVGAFPAMLYSTSPVKEFRSCAIIEKVKQASPRELWKNYGAVAGCTEEEFYDYFGGTGTGFALCISDVVPLPIPVNADAPSLRSINFHPPQSYAFVSHDAPLVHAVMGTIGGASICQ